MAAALAENTTTHNGLRPVDMAADLAALAELLEIGFGATMDEAGRAMLREMRMLSRSQGLAAVIHRFDGLLGGLQQGFVWIEDARLVGNVTVTPAPVPRGSGRGCVISNVVVHPDFRRRGLAYSLVEAALDLARRQGNTFAVLQVDPTNDGAQHLYTRLGFHDERLFTQWQRSSHLRTPSRTPNTPPITLRPPQDWRDEYELAELVRPNRRGGMGWLRPTQPGLFRMTPLKAFGYAVSGRSDEPFIIYRDPQRGHQSGIIGVARLRMAFGSFDRVDLLVHPFEQGRLEEPLISAVLRRVEGRHRALISEHPSDDTAADAVFRKYQFEPRRTELNMRIDF